MGFFKTEWCFCGHSCDGPNGSERIRASVLSNKGAVVNINNTGTGILIHRALVLTSHGTLPSITAAEEAQILVTKVDTADSHDYRRRLAPERFFITNSVLDLTVVACDPTETESVQPLCLQSSVAPCLDFGRVVYLLGRQITEEQDRDLAVGDGKITVGTDTLIKFSTDGVIWSPGSAGFDIHGNLAFMICDPMKLVSAPQRKRASATTFWRKDLPKQFGIPVPVIRHWLNQNWKGNIEELDRPRIPARLKSHQKERSTESSSNSVKLKRVHKENGQSAESSDRTGKLKDMKQMGEDEEVSSSLIGPKNEILDGIGISSGEIQAEENNGLTGIIMAEDLNSGGLRVAEKKREIPSGLTNNEGKRKSKMESWESGTHIMQMEECLDKDRFFGSEQIGPVKEYTYHEKKGTTVPWKEQDAEGPSSMVNFKGPQEEDKLALHAHKVAHGESNPSHQPEILKVSVPSSEVEIENEKQMHCGSIVPKLVSRESSPAKTAVNKKRNQVLDISFPKQVNEEPFPVEATEIQKGKHHHLQISVLPKQERDTEKNISISHLKDTMPSIHLKLGNVEQKNKGKGSISSIQDVLKAAGPSHDFERNYKKSSTFSSFEEETPMPIICIRPKHADGRKQTEGKSISQDVLQRYNLECSEPNFSLDLDEGREGLRNLVEIGNPISTTSHLEAMDVEEEIQVNTDLLSKSEPIKVKNDAEMSEEYQVAQWEEKGGCSDNGSTEAFGVEMSRISSLIQASSYRDTFDSDVETMYSAETRESRNYSPRESGGKKVAQVRRTQSSMSTARGVKTWNRNERNSSPGRTKSAYHARRNQVHPSCSRKISVQMPSYRSPDYFGPTVSSIMKKRNSDSIHNNKGTFAHTSPRWIF